MSQNDRVEQEAWTVVFSIAQGTDVVFHCYDKAHAQAVMDRVRALLEQLDETEGT